MLKFFIKNSRSFVYGSVREPARSAPPTEVPLIEIDKFDEFDEIVKFLPIMASNIS